MKMIIPLTQIKALAELNAFDIWVATQIDENDIVRTYGDLSLNMPNDIFNNRIYNEDMIYADYKHTIWDSFLAYQEKYNKKYLTDLAHHHDFIYMLLSIATRHALEKMSDKLHTHNPKAYAKVMPLELIQEECKKRYKEKINP